MEYKFKLFGRRMSVDIFWHTTKTAFWDEFAILPQLNILKCQALHIDKHTPKCILTFYWLYLLADLNIWTSKEE